MLYIIKVGGNLRAYKEILKEENGIFHFTNRISRIKEDIYEITDDTISYLNDIIASGDGIYVNINEYTYKQNMQLMAILIENLENTRQYSRSSYGSQVILGNEFDSYYNTYSLYNLITANKTLVFNKEAYIVNYHTRYGGNNIQLYIKTGDKLCEATPNIVCGLLNVDYIERRDRIYNKSVDYGQVFHINKDFIFDIDGQEYYVGAYGRLMQCNNVKRLMSSKNRFISETYMYNIPLAYLDIEESKIDIEYELIAEIRRIYVQYDYYLPLKEDTDINYIKKVITDKGVMLEYIHNQRLNRFNDDFYNQELRNKFAYKSSIAKVLNMIFELPESVSYSVARALDYNPYDVSRLKIVSGKDITKYYNENNNVSAGPLGSSCMRHQRCQEYFGIYEDNAKMLVQMTEGDKIDFRALIWEIVHNTTGEKITFIDRMYYTNEKDVSKVRNWAKEKGYAYIQHNSAGQQRAVYGDKILDLNDYHVNVINKEYNKYPFLDTFYILNGDTLSTRVLVKSLRSTEGRYN